MDRQVFDNYIKDLPENSVKRACYIVREFLKYARPMDEFENELVVGEGCAVTLKEYLKANKVLLAYSHNLMDKEDVQVQFFSCDADCSLNNGNGSFCPGEFEVDSKSKRLCKYYSDSWNI